MTNEDLIRHTAEATDRILQSMRQPPQAYHGRRSTAGGGVGETYVERPDGRPLDLRLDLIRHSPAGFEWGYAGSGPSQLALAILADYLDDDDRARELYMDFRDLIIAALDGAEWRITIADLDEIVRILEDRHRLRRQLSDGAADRYCWRGEQARDVVRRIRA